jgi:uncharacterized membrane protein YgcG
MRSKKISLMVVPLLLTACSKDDTLVQDVYQNQYDCSRDWDYQLCEQEHTSSSGGYYGHYIGPQYYRGNREVSYLNGTLKPRNNLSVGTTKASQAQYTSGRSSPIRGGFGRSGFSFGG